MTTEIAKVTKVNVSDVESPPIVEENHEDKTESVHSVLIAETGKIIGCYTIERNVNLMFEFSLLFCRDSPRRSLSQIVHLRRAITVY